jgi:hypothetical protein
MTTETRTTHNKRGSERGISLVLMTAGMLGILGMCGLALDMASFYLVRSQAQRAADGAALAGAKIFVTTGCTGNTSSPCSSSTVESAARKEAETVGNQNLVNGQSPAIVDSDISFDMSYAGDPIITVNVQLTTAHGNPVPTYFARILKYSTVNISATATAEAYNQGGQGSGATVNLTCIKPFIVPNCDTARVVSASNANANLNCPDGKGYDSYFVDPNSGSLINPGLWPSGSVGEPYTLHYAAGPGNYQAVDLGQGSGSSALASAIEDCYPTSFTCGNSVNQVPGKEAGPITPALETLIHQGTDCNTNSGQDTIAYSAGNVPPYTITAGGSNPNTAMIGKTISSSDSIITVPMYDGSSPTTGPYTIAGFMQVFVTYGCHSGSDYLVYTTIFNIPGCPGGSGSAGGSGGGCMGGNMGGGSGGGNTTSVSGGGVSTIPIRLIQNPS